MYYSAMHEFIYRAADLELYCRKENDALIPVDTTYLTFLPEYPMTRLYPLVPVSIYTLRWKHSHQDILGV